jgi:PD-(D/E)XK endonuclease
MDTMQKGEIAILEVSKRAIEKGFIPSRPIIEGTVYDIVIDDGVKLMKVQVKYGDFRRKGYTGSIIVSSRRQSAKESKYLKNDIDVILAYLPSVDKIVLLTREMFGGKYSVSIRTEKPKNNQTKKIIFIDDVIW